MKCYRFSALLLFAGAILMTSCHKEDVVPTQTITFETLTVPAAGYWNGSDASGSFTSGNLKFSNQFDSKWQTWAGFVYSQKSDVVVQGFDNQYSVYDSTNGSNKFALFYPSFSGDVFASFPAQESHVVQSIDLCNSTYTALSMKNGDAYSKKFGGVAGTDQDWFKVTVNGYDVNGLKVGSVSCYLADYQSSESSKDYILNKWTSFDLTSLGKINKLSFEFSSSDTGKYGINTPTYLCLDNIRYVE